MSRLQFIQQFLILHIFLQNFLSHLGVWQTKVSISQVSYHYFCVPPLSIIACFSYLVYVTIDFILLDIFVFTLFYFFLCGMSLRFLFYRLHKNKTLDLYCRHNLLYSIIIVIAGKKKLNIIKICKLGDKNEKDISGRRR